MHVASSNQKADRGNARTMRSIAVSVLCGANVLLFSLPVGAQPTAPAIMPATPPPSTHKALPSVAKCVQVTPSVNGGLKSSYVRNVCKTVTVDVKYCYHTLKREFAQFEPLSCDLGHFGSTGPIPPGERKAITFVPASILTFSCPYPQGGLDFGAGVDTLVPVTGKTPFVCRAH